MNIGNMGGGYNGIGKVKWGRRWKGRVEERILGEINKIKDYWKFYIENYYGRSFLKCIYGSEVFIL